MTTKEFSDAFDTLINSYGTRINFGDAAPSALAFDEYEKSLFLTQAQEQIVTELYTGRNNKSSSFEETEELRSNLKGLIKTVTLVESSNESKGISKYSKFFNLPDDIPDDILFITYESAVLSDDNAGCKNGSEIPVVPVTQDEFNRIMNNPFRWASERRALRLDNGLNVAEVVTKYNIKDYTIRYLSKPTPIVLTNLGEVSIDGTNKITECKLNSAMHRYILERAVALAIASRGIQSK